MTQNARNQPSDSEGHSGRGSKDQRERIRHQGFDDVNYEQVRQPYNPQDGNNRSGNNTNSGRNSGKRRDEL